MILVDDYIQLQSLSAKKPIISKAKNRPSGGRRGGTCCYPHPYFPSIPSVSIDVTCGGEGESSFIVITTSSKANINNDISTALQIEFIIH